MNSTDTLIIGAGPAGSSCALRLAQEGREVTVIDRATFPRHKVCGGGIPVRTRSLLPEGFESVVEATIRSTTLKGGLWQGLTLTGTTLADVVDRERFDAFLLNAAAQAGAQLSEGTELQGLERDVGHWKVHTNQGPIRASAVCAADGVLSRTARLAGATPNAYGLALEGYLPIPASASEATRETAVFNFACERHGYGWVFPRAKEYAIGIGTSRWPAPDLPGRLQRFAGRINTDSTATLQRLKGAPLPRFEAPQPWYAKDSLYLLGDAAGLVDPLTGEGIYYAVESGHLAAEAICHGGPETYHRRISESMARELSIAAYFAQKRPLIPAWLMGLSLSVGRFKRYAEMFVRLLSGETTYETLYATMHRGRSYE
ncbi:MAG: geranylgeranyl reductase family protein [Planctomycetota bacterium]|jgi:geranylgeranyl reductase family protein